MNFFNNIKETLENVSISLKNQNPEKQKTPEHNIHEFAGAELLLRFQNSWRLIHDDHTYCAKLASDCDSSLKKFQHKVQHNTHLIRNLHNQCKALLTVLGQVDSISNKLKDIALQITKIEEDLTSLECLNIKVFYAEQRRAKEQVFEGRVLLKDALIDNFKKEKIEKSKKEVEEMERVMRMKVQERYATFEEEHKRQMQMYMLTGAVPYHERIKKDKEEKTLSEIQLDFPQEELEGFLKDDLPGTDEDDEEDNNNNEEESNMNNNDASNNDSSENNNSNNNNSNNNNSNNNNSNNIHTKNSYQSTFNIGDNESNKTKNNKSPYSIDHDSSSGNNTNRSDNNQNLNSNNVIYAENNFNNDINKPNTINNETFVDGEDFVVL